MERDRVRERKKGSWEGMWEAERGDRKFKIRMRDERRKKVLKARKAVK